MGGIACGCGYYCSWAMKPYEALRLLRGEFARIEQINFSEVRSGYGQTRCYGPTWGIPLQSSVASHFADH